MSYIISTSQDRKNIDINKTQKSVFISNSYQSVDPINISSWSDWALYDFISGNGTESNPFIIENIEIKGDGIKTIQSGNNTLLDTSKFGIFINANGSFLIRNCTISHTSIGIYLSIGISPGVYPISDIEIGDCSVGIYNRWQHVKVNISNCFIHNCNMISVKAKFDLTNFLNYGGIGMWIRSGGGTIENCRIENCSFGMTAGLLQKFHNNELINCGFIPDYDFMFYMDYDSSNTVNGKPIGIFGSYWGDDNLVFTQSDALQYGQLIFAVCNNLTLSNIRITECCSIGIQVISLGMNQTTYLNNIICENQELGLYFYGRNIIANNLYAKNCKAGFYFNDIKNSKFTKIMTDNTDIPIYAITTINNLTIEIEQSTRLYLIDPYAWYGDKVHVESSDSSFNISMSYITELGVQGYCIQFNDIETYQVSLTVPLDMITANFTVISVPRYTRPDGTIAIPGYHFFWVWSVIIIGFLVLIESYRRFYRK
ncbi:MAG: right-handed parallel beta-helix repeat-containing protein [Candidatus Hermodarchaeota archaeon]